MDVWIIQNGEKTGPFHDFEIRRRIGAGELAADTPAWHEGLPQWIPLGETALFAREFEAPPHEPEPAVEPAAAGEEMVPPAPGQPHLVRRFWARWFDLYLFSGVWWFAIWAAGRDIGATLNHPWIMLLQYVPWFVLETLLIHYFGRTPGKWLLGLRVCNDDGSPLGLAEATRRSVRVLFIGLGFGWFPLTLICQLMAWFTTRRIGRPLWDHAGGHRVTAGPLHPLRIAAYVIILFIALQLQALVVVPYLMEEAAKTSPPLKEFFQKHPPLQLPKNS